MVAKFEELRISDDELQQELDILVEKGLVEKVKDPDGREVYKIREAQSEEAGRGVMVIGDDEDPSEYS